MDQLDKKALQSAQFWANSTGIPIVVSAEGEKRHYYLKGASVPIRGEILAEVNPANTTHPKFVHVGGELWPAAEPISCNPQTMTVSEPHDLTDNWLHVHHFDDGRSTMVHVTPTGLSIHLI